MSESIAMERVSVVGKMSGPSSHPATSPPGPGLAGVMAGKSGGSGEAGGGETFGAERFHERARNKIGDSVSDNVPSSGVAGKATPGVIQRRVRGPSYANGDFVLHELEGADACEGAVVLEGFPSALGVASMTAAHIIDALELPVVGYFSSPSLRADARILNGQPVFPFRVHGDERGVVFFAEAPLPQALIPDYVAHLLAWADRHKAAHIFAIEAQPELELKAEDGTRVPLAPKMRKKRGHVGAHVGAPMMARSLPMYASGIRPGMMMGLHPLDADSDSDSDSDDGENEDWDSYSESEDDDEGGEGGEGEDYFLTTDVGMAAKLEAAQFTPLSEGAVSGVAGALLANAAVGGLVNPGSEVTDVTVLLVRASPAFQDGIAAAKVISTLVVLTPSLVMAANTSRMVRKSSRKRKSVLKRRMKESKIEEGVEAMRRLRKHSEAPTTMYM